MHYLYSEGTIADQKGKALFTTLLKLAQENDLDKIKISVLCREAEVSRQFYYQHFTSKEQIIDSMFDQEYQQYLRIISKYQITGTYQMAVYFFKFFYDFRESINQMIKANLEYLVYYKFRDYFVEMLKNDLVDGHHEYSDYWSAYAAGGLSELLIAWIQKKTPESPERMAKILVEFIK